MRGRPPDRFDFTGQKIRFQFKAVGARHGRTWRRLSDECEHRKLLQQRTLVLFRGLLRHYYQINFCFYSYNQFLLAFTEGILSSLSYPIIYRIINLILRLMAEITAYNLNQEMLTRLTFMNPEFLLQSFESPFGCQVNYSHFGQHASRGN